MKLRKIEGFFSSTNTVVTVSALARHCGVKPNTLSKLITRKKWRNLSGMMLAFNVIKFYNDKRVSDYLTALPDEAEKFETFLIEGGIIQIGGSLQSRLR